MPIPSSYVEWVFLWLVQITCIFSSDQEELQSGPALEEFRMHLGLILMMGFWVLSWYSNGMRPLVALEGWVSFVCWKNVNNFWSEGGLQWFQKHVHSLKILSLQEADRNSPPIACRLD